MTNEEVIAKLKALLELKVEIDGRTLRMMGGDSIAALVRAIEILEERK